MAEHVILRLDNVQATQDNSLMRSGLYKVSNTDTDIDNGMPVEVGALVNGERELRLLTAATATPTVLGITSTPEVNSEGDYDNDGHNLLTFYNKAGKAVRVHLLQAGDIFSVSALAFDGTAPTEGQVVGIASGKWKAGAANEIGKCIDIEDVSGKTLYTIEISTDKINQ